ncbi:MAG: site-specific DNA-methyltransferase [Coprobacillaceae bacterium]
MNKLNLESKDLISNNVELISQLFPHCITEQEGEKVVDFNKLKEEFTDELVDEAKEKYELNWPGKRAAINEARIKTNKTLLPLEEKSINFEDTNNVYIEGDNLEVLKLLQESYLNKVKCIYIDPPYNTGKDFIYKDDFKQSLEDELIESGQIDEDGNKFIQNTETNGRYHSDWLSMMYPRLKLARNLLKDNGVIFLSIDDNEYNNLKKICDEVFGEKNHLSTLINVVKPEGRNYGNIAVCHEYLLVYGKSENACLNEVEKKNVSFKFEDKTSGYNLKSLVNGNSAFTSNNRPNLHYPIYISAEGDLNGHHEVTMNTNDIPVFPGMNKAGKAVWRWGSDKVKKESYDLIGRKGLDGCFRIEQKMRKTTTMQKSVISEKEYYTKSAGDLLERLMGIKVFDFPKSIEYIKMLISLNCNEDDYVLDFFSGSSTTAHSILDLNAADNENRKYIMVQLPESIDEKNSKSAYDFCIENDLEPIIPSIAQERIKRAGAKIKEETGADIDYGFRVFKLSDSILKANEVLPSDLQQDLLSESDSKYVDDISKLDIVTSVILDLGLMLDSKIENIGNDNFVVEEDLLFISLSEEYDSSVLESIRNIMPDQVVLDEKTFAGNDALMTNVIQQINEINSDITINIL